MRCTRMIRLDRTRILVFVLPTAFIVTAVWRSRNIHKRSSIDQVLESPQSTVNSAVNAIQGSGSAEMAFLYEKWYVQDHQRRADTLKSADHTHHLYYATQDQLHCRNKIRFGNVLDGGKYVCSPHVLYNNNNCVIYSLGVANDTSFESDLIQFTNDSCEIYGFDMSSRSRKYFMALPSKKIHFDAVKIIGKKPKYHPFMLMSGSASIPSLMQENEHRRLDILKVDLELAEYEALPPLLDKVYNGEITICQILIEIHHGEIGYVNGRHIINTVKWKLPGSVCHREITESFRQKKKVNECQDKLLAPLSEYFQDQPLKLLQQFERAGFLQFNQESNMMYCLSHGCAEYAYVHRDCFEELGLSEADLYNSISYLRDFDSVLCFLQTP